MAWNSSARMMVGDVADGIQIYPQVNNRVKILKQELSKIPAGNPTVVGEKYNSLMQPIFSKLDELLNQTSRRAETLHERWFQRTYGESTNCILIFNRRSLEEGDQAVQRASRCRYGNLISPIEGRKTLPLRC